MSTSADEAPLVVTLRLDDLSFARLDAWRRRHFPAERNHLPAHLSLFHALPGVERARVEATLAREAAGSEVLPLAFTRPVRMARGALIAVQAPGLVALHGRLARSFEPWLTAQDRQRLAPHVTVMNKATAEAARAALAELAAGFVPWQGRGEALLLWAYRGGPWEPLGRFPLGEGLSP